MPGSPSEVAGFKPGDVMVAVDNNFTRNIQTYKTLMQNPGQKLKILILRDGEPIILTLKVKSIL
jgi:C-terminal processing protease CtpA/Prc